MATSIGDLVKKGKKWAKTAMDRASVLKPFMNVNATTGGSPEPGASGRAVTLNDLWDAEKKRRQLAEQKHVQELNRKGGNFPAGGSGRVGGISFTGAGGRPFSVDKDLLGPGSHGVLVRDLSAARMREASERAAFKALRAEERRMAQKELEAKGEWAERNWGMIRENILKSWEDQRVERLKLQRERLLKRAEGDALAKGLAAMAPLAPRPKAGPGSMSDGKASLAERRAAAGMHADGTIKAQDFGAAGIRVYDPSAGVSGLSHRGFGKETDTPGVVTISGQASKTVQDLAVGQLRRRQETAENLAEEARIKKEMEDWRKKLAEQPEESKSAYKGGKARRRARLQVLSRR